jgi:methionine aminopeptidase
MSIESHADWEGLSEAAQVASLTLDTLMHQVRPGVTTGDLDRTAAR